jgi:hypothetical protein
MLNAGGKKNSKFLVGEDLLCNNAAMMVPVLRDIKKNTPYINICTDKLQQIRPMIQFLFRPILTFTNVKDILTCPQV